MTLLITLSFATVLLSSGNTSNVILLHNGDLNSTYTLILSISHLIISLFVKREFDLFMTFFVIYEYYVNDAFKIWMEWDLFSPYRPYRAVKLAPSIQPLLVLLTTLHRDTTLV